MIRAFKNEDQFLEKEMQMMDKTTIHFIAHHSCWVWFNLRLYYTCKLVALAGMIACLGMKGQVSSVTLSMVLTYTLDLDWVQHMFGCFNWLERNLINCERLFKLQEIVQEKTKGEVSVDEDTWVKEGKIKFEDV